MGCCGNASSEQARANPTLDTVGKPLQKNAGSQQLNIYSKAVFTGVMNEHCQAQQDEIETNFDPESMVYNQENIESKRSEIDMQALYEMKKVQKDWADQVEKSIIEIKADNGEMIKVYVNKSKQCGPNSAAFVYAHGGYGVALSAKSCNELMVRWAYKYKCIVFNVEYRLAPEVKVPVAQRDFMHAFYHVHDNAASFGVDPTKIVIGGDNGGGWVCMGAAYQMIKDGKSHLPKFMLLRSSMHSITIQQEAYGNLANFEKYTQDMFYSIFANLLATNFEKQQQEEDPELFPAKMPMDQLRKLPPTVICTGEFDFMRRESTFLISRLKQTDRLLDVLDMPQVFHGYETNVDSPAAIQAENETIKLWNHVFSQ